MTWVVVSDDGNTSEPFDSRSEAESRIDDLDGLVDAELQRKETDGGAVESEHAGGNSTDSDAEPTPVAAQDAVDAIETVKDGSLDTDPLNILPGFMTDQIQGQQAVNKRGYAMIAERYDIEVSTEMVQSPWDNDEGRVVCKATAITDDGRTHNAYGTACADDGDDSSNLIELADTRSQKRAVQWASGFGIVGYQELTGQLEGDQ